MRVIAGSARSIPLKSVKGDKTRPTTDRIKETLFNILNPYLYDAYVLDLFTGAGGLGIEALSRGAKKAVFVDKSKEAVKIIKENLSKTHFSDDADIYTGDVLDMCATMNIEKPFDVIIMDPPYGKGYWKNVLSLLSKTRLVDEHTLVVVEEDLSDDVEEGNIYGGFELNRIKNYRHNRHLFFNLSKYMKIGLYAGSFDPPTLGHLDVIKRASSFIDHLIVGVFNNSEKTPLFTTDERVNMLEDILKDYKNVEVATFSGLLVDFARERDVHILVRGLRAVTDFEYEIAMAQTNRVMEPSVDTVFLTTSLEYSYLSSSIVKEIAKNGGGLDEFVPQQIIQRIYDKYDIGKKA